jgi:hypothetical protein
LLVTVAEVEAAFGFTEGLSHLKGWTGYTGGYGWVELLAFPLSYKRRSL